MRGKILIVDDEQAMCEMLADDLKRNGFQPTWCNSSEKAIDLLKAQSFDVLLADLNMPNMNGMEFLKIIKGNQKTSHIPFIMLTVEAIQKTMNKALSFDVDSYIVKPVSEQQLMEEVWRIFHRHQRA